MAANLTARQYKWTAARWRGINETLARFKAAKVEKQQEILTLNDEISVLREERSGLKGLVEGAMSAYELDHAVARNVGEDE